MRDKGQFTLIEIIAGVTIACIIFIIFYAVMNEKPYFNQDEKMEYCMEQYKDFDYCKYKLGVK